MSEYSAPVMIRWRMPAAIPRESVSRMPPVALNALLAEPSLDLLILVSTKACGSKAERSPTTLLSAMSGSKPAMVMSKLRVRAILTASRMESARRGPLMAGGGTLLRGRSKEVSAEVSVSAAEAVWVRKRGDRNMNSTPKHRENDLGGLMNNLAPRHWRLASRIDFTMILHSNLQDRASGNKGAYYSHRGENGNTFLLPRRLLFVN